MAPLPMHPDQGLLRPLFTTRALVSYCILTYYLPRAFYTSVLEMLVGRNFVHPPISPAGSCDDLG
jgi:hypothetical protein